MSPCLSGMTDIRLGAFIRTFDNFDGTKGVVLSLVHAFEEILDVQEQKDTIFREGYLSLCLGSSVCPFEF